MLLDSSVPRNARIMQRSRRVTISSCVVILLFTLWYFLPTSDRHKLFGDVSSPIKTLDFLRQSTEKLSLDPSSQVIYSRRCIRPRFSSQLDRTAVTNISEPLIIDQVTLQLNHLDGSNRFLSECTPIELSVPRPYDARQGYPEFIFGMATSYERLRDSISSIAHWCSGRGSKLVVVVDDWEDRSADVIQLEVEYRGSGIEAKFIKPFARNHSTSQSHFMVLVQMVKESGPDTKWFGLLDDDTFFPHLQPLSDALAKFNHMTDMYVGALSEDFGSIQNFGLMAYGGAGVYLSAVLARKLGAPESATTCLQESPPDLGDIIVRNCVYSHSRAKLTWLHGLYQHDLTGDLSGFFESGIEPLNLHHWKSWYDEPVVSMASSANFCGNCFLQRWRFGQDTVFSNGYSIVTYRHGVEDIDLDKMEHTFGAVYGDVDPSYDFTIGPLREKLEDGEKKRYHLEASEIRDGVMRQLYVWKGNKGNQETNALDEVVELIWEA